ncbi:unnamed protein product [Durusdinium trenchii]|uniref:Uncharacterized protein n=1 Tax=Durusdinium trenchii TaxID=1381693 RepID=A0ABP0PLQ5_9DINO
MAVPTVPRVRLSDLSPTEKERMLSFLVANQVDFKPDLSGNFSATVKILPPPAKSKGAADPRSGSVRQGERCAQAEERYTVFTDGWLGALHEQHSRSAGGTQETGPAGCSRQRCSGGAQDTVQDLHWLVAQRHPASKDDDQGRACELHRGGLHGPIQPGPNAGPATCGGRGQWWEEEEKTAGLPTDLTTFPQSVLTVVGKRYGLRQMVGQVCWSLTKSVDEVRSAHQGVETFARFLEESYDAVDLLFYLEMRWAARQMTMPRGVWTSWRKTPQVFTGPHQRALASKTTCPNNKPPLTLKQALAAVREGIDPEAPEALKAKIFSRLKAENGGDSTFDWDHFLSICTQEFRKARSIAVPKQVQGFAQQIRERWQLSVPDAFEKFERTGSGLLRGDAFKEVCEELGLTPTNAEDVWCLLDVEKKGYVEKEAWNVLDVHDEADQGNDEELVYPPVYPPGWDDQLSPEESEAIQQEAREVARRLLSSLEEHEEVKPSEVLGWALRSVLQRKGHDLQRGARDEQRGFAPQRSGQEVSQSGDPRSAWTTGAPTASDGGDAERSLEDTVREHLAAATNQLVDEGLQEAGGTWTKEMAPVKEALLEEFMMVTDALMEALVIGDLDAWLQQLHIEEADAEQHKHFQELAAEFQELLTADEASEEQLVSRVCAATTSFQELKVLCRVRADELLQEHGVGGTPPQHEHQAVISSEPTGDSTQAEGAEGLEIPEAF